MIEFRFAREKELALEYAERLDNAAAAAILTRGTILGAEDAEILANFYWQMVDASLEDDIEPWLERLHNTLAIACGNAGYEDVWNDAVSRA